MRSGWVAMLLMLLFVGGDAICQQTSKATEVPATGVQTTPPKPPIAPQDTNDSKTQVRLLEAQLQITREHQGALLNTVYWALSGVFVIVGLLVGFGWFVNFKVYERDKQALRSELVAAVQTKTTELSQSVQNELAKAVARLPANLREEIVKSEQSLKGRLSSLDARLFRIEFDTRKKEMHANPSLDMSLTDALHLLELSHKRALDEVPDIIHFMLKTIDKGGKLTADEITRVNAVLEVLPSHYKTLTEKLSGKLVASDIFGR